MAEASRDTHPDEIRSDLDVLIEMAKYVDRDEQAVHRQLESLKSKLDKFIHEKRSHSGGGSAS